MKNNLYILICIIAVVFVSGCKTTQPFALDGFAAYKSTEPYRAVSPEGVMFSIRTAKNEPSADIDFWKVALKKHMLGSGYIFLKESEVTAGSDKGYVLELSAPVGNQDFIYLIAIFVKDSQIKIVESAGEILNFEEKRPAIMAAIGKL